MPGDDLKEFFPKDLTRQTRAIRNFWAEWCAPCRILAPTFKEMAGQYEGKMKFFKLDTEACQEIPIQYGIRSIPTVLFFHRGKVVAHEIGAVPKKKLQMTIDQVVKAAAS